MWEQFEFVRRVGRAGNRARLLGIILVIGLSSGCYREYRDSNVQSFEPGEAVVLDGKRLYFTRSQDSFEDVVASSSSKLTPIWGAQPYYYRAVSEQREFLVDPSDHKPVDFSSSDPYGIPGSGTSNFPSNFFGTYVGSDGTISFSWPGQGNGDLVAHFSSQQISLLPIDATVGGARVTYEAISDMFVVTFENVSGNSMQFIMFAGYSEEARPPGLDGFHPDDIIIIYQAVSEDTRAGVVGISGGGIWDTSPQGLEDFFEEFNEYFGGEVDLVESTNTESGGYVRVVPLP